MKNLNTPDGKVLQELLVKKVCFCMDNIYSGVIASLDLDGSMINAMVKSFKFLKGPKNATGYGIYGTM